MNEVFKTIRDDRIMLYSSYTSIIFILLGLLYLTLFFSKLPPLLPIFNQMSWGEARIGSRSQIFIPLFIVFIVITTNFMVSTKLYGKIPLLSRIVSIISLLLSFLVFLFVVRTVGLSAA